MSQKRLYRDVDNARIAGVCAGIANYFGIETWVVRLLTITFGLFNGGLVLIAYLAAWLLMDKAPPQYAAEHGDEPRVKAKAWQAGQSPAELLTRLEARFNNMEMQVQQLEKYVTSTAYKVNREFNKL